MWRPILIQRAPQLTPRVGLVDFRWGQVIAHANGGPGVLKEVEYVFAVLGLPTDASFRGPDGMDAQFARFAAMMALAERVCGLDESMRATICGINARAMESSLNRAKNMFYCNDAGRTGLLTLEVLELELRAGCVSQSLRFTCINPETFLDAHYNLLPAHPSVQSDDCLATSVSFADKQKAWR